MTGARDGEDPVRAERGACPGERARGTRAAVVRAPAVLPVYPRAHNAGTLGGSQPVRAV